MVGLFRRSHEPPAHRGRCRASATAGASAMVIGAAGGDRHRLSAREPRPAAPADPRPLPHALRPAQGHGHPRGHHGPQGRHLLRHASYLDAGGSEMQLDSRPSDAIALAIRAKAPVLVEDRVFDKSDLAAGPVPRRRASSRWLRDEPAAPGRRRDGGGPRQPAVGDPAPHRRRLRQARGEVRRPDRARGGADQARDRRSPRSAACARPRASCGASRRRSRIPSSTASGASRRPRACCSTARPAPASRCSARALATETGAVFYHLKLMNLTSKFGPNTGELLQEILAVAKEQGQGRGLPRRGRTRCRSSICCRRRRRARPRARLVAALCEKLDDLDDFSRMHRRRGSTSRTDSVDSSLVAPGRLDRLVEVTLPDGADQQEILELARASAPRATRGGTLFARHRLPLAACRRWAA